MYIMSGFASGNWNEAEKISLPGKRTNIKANEIKEIIIPMSHGAVYCIGMVYFRTKTLHTVTEKAGLNETCIWEIIMNSFHI